MQVIRRAFGISCLAACLAAPLRAQDSRELVLQVNGGAIHGLASIDRNRVYDTETGLSLSGSLGVKVIDRLVARADVNYAKTPLRFHGAELGSDIDRLFASLIAQIQFPGSSGLNPYVLAGGGAVFLNQHATTDPKKTVAHFLTGLGLGYRIGQTGVSMHAEGRVYLYQPRGLVGGDRDESRFQGDLAFSAGLSYAIPFGRH